MNDVSVNASLSTLPEFWQDSFIN